MKKNMRRTDKGFTLIELMIAMAITLVVMGAIFMTFKSQQDSYVVQDQVTRMQQNLRGAMYVMTRDIQMAGYYTNFDKTSCLTDWDNDGNIDSGFRPLIYARDNVNDSGGGDNIKDNTDIIVIVKASQDFNRTLLAGEGTITAGTITLLGNRDLDGDASNDPDLDTNNKYGLLVKKDLSKADFFEVNNASGTITPPDGLSENYGEGDLIFRADVIIYRVDDDPAHPSLHRTNLSSSSGSTTVAEDIDSLQVRYRLSGSSSFVPASDTTFNPANVRAVEVSLLARTGRTIRGYTGPSTYSIGGDSVTAGDGYRRKVLTTVIETRNIGLGL
jgi:type IV pilus assembly protein PilW